MAEKNYTVRLKMRDGPKEWTEERSVWAETREDAIALAAAEAHHTYNVRGATVEADDGK